MVRITPTAPHPSRLDRARLVVLVAIACGGMAGAASRYGLTALVGGEGRTWPWHTFVENVSGAFLLGVVLVVIDRRFPRSRLLRPFLGVGFLGSFTTFSALAVEADHLARDGQALLAGGYWFASITLGLAAAAAGIALARRLTRPHPEAR